VKVKPKVYQKLRVYDDYEKIGIVSSPTRELIGNGTLFTMLNYSSNLNFGFINTS